MTEKALVGNGADEEQVKRGGQKAEDRRKRELADLDWVVSDERGRRVMWRFMSECGAFAGVWSYDEAELRFRAARQDLGQWMRNEIIQARKGVFQQMMLEFEKEKENG